MSRFCTESQMRPHNCTTASILDYFERVRHYSPPMLSVKRVLQLFWMALCVAYWALLPQFYLVYNEGNRYSVGWTYATYFSILAAISLLGVIYSLMAGVMLWMGRRVSSWQAPLRIVLGGIVGAILLRTIISLVDKTGGPFSTLLNLSGFKVLKFGFYLLPFAILWRYPQTAKVGLKISSVVLSILLIGFLVVPWFWPTYGWDDNEPQVPDQRYSAVTNSIYILVFDAWSSSLSFTPKQLATMPGLTGFLDQADRFENAQSCGPFTHVSIPRFLYQADPGMREMMYDEVQKSVRKNLLHQYGFTSIFDLSDRHYKTVLGFYLYYPDTIGAHVDYCGRYATDSALGLNINFLRELLFSQVEFLRHVGVDVAGPTTRWDLDTDIFVAQQKTRQKLANILRGLPAMNMTFLHIPFPHPPYQFRPDGSPRDPILKDVSVWPNVAGYMDNLGYTDTLLIDFIEALKRRGDFDSSLIILTSDHTWGYDPAQPYPGDAHHDFFTEDDLLKSSFTRHVPLIIKHPGQSVARTFSQSVSCWDLHQLFSQYLAQPSETMDFEWWSREDLPSEQRVVN